MFIKVGEKWVNTDCVERLWVNTDCVERLWVHDDNVYISTVEPVFAYRYGHHKSHEEAVKAMDELAEKINAALGCKPAAREKVVMKYEEHGDEHNIIGVYRCSHCKTVIRDEHSWYKFCPVCGREIERWE